jgi:Transcriptional regulator containing an amidase domain and an AraC-type DNA-binding HTH domain
MLNIQVVLFDGFDPMDAVAPYEVFGAAALFAGDDALSVELVTAEGPRSVVSGTNGLKLEATGRLDPERGGIILVPGASGRIEGEGPGTVPAILGRTLITPLTGLMRQAFERTDTVIATVCGGSLLLAMGGMLEGRPAVTHRLGMHALEAAGAVPVAARVVDDGSLVTGGGVTSGLDVALYLVEREFGPRIAHAVEQLFEYERRGTVWRKRGMAPLVHQAATDEHPGDAKNKTLATPVAPQPEGFHPSVFDGGWEAIIATPVGKLQAKLSIAVKGGTIQGSATQGEETVPLLDPELRGRSLCWSLRVTKPMRLNLKFEVTVEGDVMTGTAKAGMLPASKVTGRRVR